LLKLTGSREVPVQWVTVRVAKRDASGAIVNEKGPDGNEQPVIEHTRLEPAVGGVRLSNVVRTLFDAARIYKALGDKESEAVTLANAVQWCGLRENLLRHGPPADVGEQQQLMDRPRYWCERCGNQVPTTKKGRPKFTKCDACHRHVCGFCSPSYRVGSRTGRIYYYCLDCEWNADSRPLSWPTGKSVQGGLPNV